MYFVQYLSRINLRNLVSFFLILVFVLMSVGCGARFVIDYSRAVVNDVPAPRTTNALIRVSESGPSFYVHATNFKSRDSWDVIFYVRVDHPEPKERFISDYYSIHGPKSEYILDPAYFFMEVLIDAQAHYVTLDPSTICLSFEKTANTKVCPQAWISPSPPLETKVALLGLGISELWAGKGSYHTGLCKNAFTTQKTKISGNELIPVPGSGPPFNDVTTNQHVEVDRNEVKCIALRYRIRPPDPQEKFILKLGDIQVDRKPVTLPNIRYEPDRAEYVSG